MYYKNKQHLSPDNMEFNVLLPHLVTEVCPASFIEE